MTDHSAHNDPPAETTQNVLSATNESSRLTPPFLLDSQNVPVIEIDTDEGNGNDRDSAIDAEGQSITSASLTSSILDYQYANGRRYHAYKRGAYLLPNDEEEQERLDLLHHVFLLILGGRPFVSPVHLPQRILDVGTGTGLWAMDVADEHPSAQVFGTDLSPIQPGWVPPNVQFYIDDVESDWMYDADDAFDLIHTRVMGGSIGDWDKFVRQGFAHLKPGGWLELHEPESWLTSDDNTKDRATYTEKFQTKCIEAAEKFGKEINLAHTHKQRLIEAGFVDVRDDVIKIPVGSWPKDPRLKEIGRFWLEHLIGGVEVYTLGFIGQILRWSETECRVLAAKVAEELRDRRNHLYVNLHVICGRKQS